jgi:hypothetical protein
VKKQDDGGRCKAEIARVSVSNLLLLDFPDLHAPTRGGHSGPKKSSACHNSAQFESLVSLMSSGRVRANFTSSKRRGPALLTTRTAFFLSLQPPCCLKRQLHGRRCITTNHRKAGTITPATSTLATPQRGSRRTTPPLTARPNKPKRLQFSQTPQHLRSEVRASHSRTSPPLASKQLAAPTATTRKQGRRSRASPRGRWARDPLLVEGSI